MTLLLSDPRIAVVPVHDAGDPLVRLPEHLSPTRQPVRAALAGRLETAAAALVAQGDGVGLLVVEGHRSPVAQQRIIDRYTRELRGLHAGISDAELAVLTSRFVSPLAVAPHVAGAAVDLTLAGPDGVPLDLGTPIDATPEQSDGSCYTDAPASAIGATARANRDLMAAVLGGAGLVNYPTEWWHWSYGDRYWAAVTGADHALYGPVSGDVVVSAA